MARLAAAHEYTAEIGNTLIQIYAFLENSQGGKSLLQVSEAYLYVEFARQALAVGHAVACVCRRYRRGLRTRMMVDHLRCCR
jgi:hypothetical protein